MAAQKKRKCIALFLFMAIYFAQGFYSLAFAFDTGSIDPARVEGAITNVSDPGLVQKRLGGESNAPPSSAIKSLVEPQQPTESSPLDKIKFKLTKVIIKGNTVYSDAQLQTIFQPSINKVISLGDLQRLVKEITKQYRRDGYLLSRALILPQVIKNGVVAVQVVEGFISEVVLQGDTGFANTLFKQYATHLTQTRPFQSAVLERDMLLMNDLPGFSVKAVIRPSKVTPAGAELVLVTERIKGQGSISYDNYGTRFIGPQQITLNASRYSFAFPGDNNTLTYITVPDPEELRMIQFVHSHPIGINGWNFTLGGNYAQTHPLFTLAPLDIIGRSFYVFTDLSHTILRTRTANIFMHGALNYENVTSTVLSQLFYADRYRSLVVGGNADAIDHWNGINNVGLDLEQGFDILGAGKHVRQSRPLGVSDYTKVSVNASHLQWFTQRFSILGAMQGQYSFNPLLAAEQFSYGGSEFGRGYDPSQIVGDDGLAAKIELRLNAAPELAYLQGIQPYVFYDIGKIWNRDGVSLPAQQSAASTGLGARFVFIPQVTGNFYIAKPLTLRVPVLTVQGKNGNEIRGYFQLTAIV